MHKVIATLLTLALLCACATHHDEVISKPIIKRIAVIPASNPRWTISTYDKISTDADAILQIWISEIGLYIGTTLA
jgi:hypothetical protein